MYRVLMNDGWILWWALPMMYGYARRVGKLSHFMHFAKTQPIQVRMESSLVLDKLRINMRLSDVGSGVISMGN